ncbi:nSTAND1 domain-containing NTPase [Kitasatospora sp. NPDC054939]
MPRRESPLDQGDGPLLRFAGDLRALRERAGSPPYRQLAVRAHCSAASLSVAAGGRRLPSLAVTLAYVQACGGDVREWQHRWQLLAAELTADNAARRRVQDAGRAPYPGAAAYEAADAERFFGREALLDRLVALLAERRVVLLTGASGAGKSSLVRAGLLARLAARPDGGPVALLTPGERPVEAYEVALARLRTQPAAGRGEPVLIVDQAEELRTRCRSTAERERFLDALAAGAGTTRVVLVVRSDHEALVAGHPGFCEAGRPARLAVGHPAPEELRRAITEPALRAGCTVEGALLAVLISAAAQQPGALPLVSAALLETWRRRSGNALTLAGFQATGGFEGTLARTAEAVYGGLGRQDRERARAVFVRLGGEFRTGSGLRLAADLRTADLRAPGLRASEPHHSGLHHSGPHGPGLRAAEQSASGPRASGPDGGDFRWALSAAGPDGAPGGPVARLEFVDPGMSAVLERLARARLVVLDRDTVELAHHALAQSWPRLRGWLAESGDTPPAQRRFTDAARSWAATGRDPELLPRGTRLAQLRRRVTNGELAAPDGVERAFLEAAALADAADRRRTRRQRLAVATLAAAGGALLTLAGGERIRRVRHG